MQVWVRQCRLVRAKSARITDEIRVRSVANISRMRPSFHNTPTPSAVRHMTISHRKNGRKSRDWALVPRKIEGGLSIDAVSTAYPFDGREGSGVSSWRG